MRYIVSILWIVLFAFPVHAFTPKLRSESKPAPMHHQVQEMHSGTSYVAYVALQRDHAGISRNGLLEHYITFYGNGQVIAESPDEVNPEMFPSDRCKYVNCGIYRSIDSAVMIDWRAGPEAGDTVRLIRTTIDGEQVLLGTGGFGDELRFRVSRKYHARP